MINFPCICTYRFAVDDDLAGSSVQCPQCRRLCDVPTLDDLRSFQDDGTYLIDLTPTEVERNRLAELKRSFASEKQDETGEDIDLRPTLEEIKRAGVPSDPLASLGPASVLAPPVAPRYDPVTGELVRPIDITPTETVATAASAAQGRDRSRRTLGYARRELNEHSHSEHPLFNLLMPMNLIGMFFVLLLHVILILFATPLFFGLLVAAPFVLFGWMGLISHYGNVIEEIGPVNYDELPRLFRHASFGEDFWLPFVRACAAAIVCFFPALLALSIFKTHEPLLCEALAVIGLAFFPAAWMTAITSDNLLNLAPHRLLAVMRVGGWHYAVALVLLVVGLPIYLLGVAGSTLGFVSLFLGNHYFIGRVYIGWPSLLVGIYLMHACAWYLGLVYRKHHSEFPWLTQYYIREPKNRMAPRRVQEVPQIQTQPVDFEIEKSNPSDEPPLASIAPDPNQTGLR